MIRAYSLLPTPLIIELFKESYVRQTHNDLRNYQARRCARGQSRRYHSTHHRQRLQNPRDEDAAYVEARGRRFLRRASRTPLLRRACRVYDERPERRDGARKRRRGAGLARSDGADGFDQGAERHDSRRFRQERRRKRRAWLRFTRKRKDRIELFLQCDRVLLNGYGSVRQTADHLRRGAGHHRRAVPARRQAGVAAPGAIAWRLQLVEPQRFGEGLFPSDDDVADEPAADADLLAFPQINEMVILEARN